MTWESYTAGMDPPPKLETKLPLGLMLPLLEELKLADPNVMWARPTRAEMSQVTDNRLLRALLPRVNHVTYRTAPAIDPNTKERIREAVNDLSASLALRQQFGIKLSEPLPQLVYSADGDELRLKLEELGFTMWAGVLPHLFKAEGVIPKMEGVAPFAFGFSLYLHICPQNN